MSQYFQSIRASGRAIWLQILALDESLFCAIRSWNCSLSKKISGNTFVLMFSKQPQQKPKWKSHFKNDKFVAEELLGLCYNLSYAYFGFSLKITVFLQTVDLHFYQVRIVTWKWFVLEVAPSERIEAYFHLSVKHVAKVSKS